MRSLHSMDSPILTRWHYHATDFYEGQVYPDGCQDVILRYSKNAAPVWTVTAIDATAWPFRSVPNEHFVGFRLRPGTVVQPHALLAQVQAPPFDERTIRTAILEHSTIDPDVQEALHHLSRTATTVDAAARSGGVSVRTLQRKLTATLGKPPTFWLALARVRKAARQLTTHKPLAAIAHDCGFADQAHLHREMRRWYGHTPTQLRNDPAKLSIATGIGYA